MKHNQHMLEQNHEKWGDKVRLIGLSIDGDADTVKNHVESRGWTKVEHYHVRTAGCTADKDYGVNGVPHVLLVDTTGKIVFVGHPASRDLEADINTLLEGGTLSGEGTGASKAETGNAGKELDELVVKAAKQDFEKNSKAFMADNTEECKKLVRGFIVLVDESTYDVRT